MTKEKLDMIKERYNKVINSVKYVSNIDWSDGTRDKIALSIQDMPALLDYIDELTALMHDVHPDNWINLQSYRQLEADRDKWKARCMDGNPEEVYYKEMYETVLKRCADIEKDRDHWKKRAEALEASIHRL